MGLELLGVEFGFLKLAAPDDGLSAVVDFEHELVGVGLGVGEDFGEDEGDVGHEVDGIIVDDDVPWGLGGGVGFRFCDGGCFRHV